MSKYWVLFFIFFSFLYAEEKEDIAKVSEAVGHLIGKNLQSLGLPLDLQAVLKGMQDASEGKTSPLPDEDYEKAITKLQEQSHDLAAQKNLLEAEAFLQKNEKEPGVITVEKRKLQYKIDQVGTKEARVVQAYNTPLVRYHVRPLNGEPFPGDIEEELIVLDEALVGLKLGIVGMKEGEQRTLYIHPELAYGKESYVPNALLIFTLEILRADVSSESASASNAETLPMHTSALL